MVTWRSSITSKSAACVFAGARFISSIKIILLKMGPDLNLKSPSPGLKTEVPTTSLGIRSGVNCRREKSTSMIFAINFAVNVLATPGTPSIKIWPSHNKPISSRSTILCCPIITCAISFLTSYTALFKPLRSMRCSKRFSSISFCFYPKSASWRSFRPHWPGLFY